VRYELTAEPLTLYACHCTDCQTASGASFTLTMVVAPDSIAVLRGEPRPYERSRADGRKKSIVRCPACLTALWGVRPEAAKLATVYAGTLDDSSSLDPVGHIWTRSAQPWIEIPAGGLNYEQQPPDMLAFVRAWRSRGSDEPAA
jgi:hypothetical protein